MSITDDLTGLAKLEHDPKAAFLELFTSACMEGQMKAFGEQNLSNVIHGEGWSYVSQSLVQSS
jgi:hypothetical protein